MPGYRKVVNEIYAGISCSGYLEETLDLRSIAVLLIPDELKMDVPPVQPDDWNILPVDQVRRIWSNRNSTFSKIVLALAVLQLAIMVKNGALKLIEGFRPTPRTLKRILADAEAAKVIGTDFIANRLKIHIAAYRFSHHRQDFWLDNVLSKPEVANNFANYTGQRDKKFLHSFASGHLVTLQTLRSIESWLSFNFNEHGLGEPAFMPRSHPRVRPARNELVVWLHDPH